eukprot:6158770-Amphidinium_carterae.2
MKGVCEMNVFECFLMPGGCGLCGFQMLDCNDAVRTVERGAICGPGQRTCFVTVVGNQDIPVRSHQLCLLASQFKVDRALCLGSVLFFFFFLHRLWQEGYVWAIQNLTLISQAHQSSEPVLLFCERRKRHVRMHIHVRKSFHREPC